MKTVIMVTLVILVLSPSDVPDQCDQLVFARANPALCYAGPFGQFPGHGGGGDGGILGTIGRVLGGLTGGLL